LANKTSFTPQPFLNEVSLLMQERDRSCKCVLLGVSIRRVDFETVSTVCYALFSLKQNPCISNKVRVTCLG
jgi:hypothetical protein